MRKQHTHTLGLIPAGLAYYPVKAAVGGSMTLVIVVIYAVALRLLAERLGKKA